MCQPDFGVGKMSRSRQLPETDPEFSFGYGRYRINLKGKDAIRAGGWSIRVLLLARAMAILFPAVAFAIAILMWRSG
jgi:hypothetical protein